MANWSGARVDASAINGGKEYERKDRVSREQLNAIVNNSLYSQAVSEEALEKADSAFTANGTIARVNGVAQPFLDFKQDPNTSLMYYTTIYDEDIENAIRPSTQTGSNLTLDVSQYDELVAYFLSASSPTASTVMGKVFVDLKTVSNSGTYSYVGTTTTSNNYYGFSAVSGETEAHHKATVRVSAEKNTINVASVSFNWGSASSVDYGRIKFYRILGVKYGNSN